MTDASKPPACDECGVTDTATTLHSASGIRLCTDRDACKARQRSSPPESGECPCHDGSCGVCHVCQKGRVDHPAPFPCPPTSSPERQRVNIKAAIADPEQRKKLVDGVVQFLCEVENHSHPSPPSPGRMSPKEERDFNERLGYAYAGTLSPERGRMREEDFRFLIKRLQTASHPFEGDVADLITEVCRVREDARLLADEMYDRAPEGWHAALLRDAPKHPRAALAAAIERNRTRKEE